MCKEYQTCIVFMLGYPAMGKRTVGEHLAALLDGVLVDNQLVSRPLVARRGSLFLSVMLTCDIDVQVSRIDNEDRVALMKGSDPEGYRWHRLNTTLFEPPSDVVLHIDTSEADPRTSAKAIYEALMERGFSPNHK